MKKIILTTWMIAGFAAMAPAQGLLSKLKGNKAEEATAAPASDEYGLSGVYKLSTPWDYYGDKVEDMIVEFVKEENGAIVNRFKITMIRKVRGSKQKVDPTEFKFEEKMFTKMGVMLFTGNLVNKPFDIMQLDKDVLFLNCTSQKGYVVLAKNADLLKTWDEETGLAKYEAGKKKTDAAASAGLRKKLENFKAYKENVGKIIFTGGQGAFENLKDDASENPANFLTEWVTGNGLAMKGYFDKSINEVCAECGGAYNVVFEMGKYKVDWMQIRSSSSAYSKLHSPKVLFKSEYMAQSWLWDNFDFNRALTYAIHQNIADGTLKDGGKLNLKVTIYTFKDNTNGTKMAEGSLLVKYNAGAGGWVDRYNAFKDAIE